MSKSQRIMLELSIASVLAHRLAKRVVLKCKRMRIDSRSRYYGNLFVLESTEFEAECRRVMTDYKLSPEIIDRIFRHVIPQASSEVHIFEKRGEFTSSGADQCSLEVVLGQQLLKLAEG